MKPVLEFTIELSNKDGDFTTPTTLKIISDKNSAFRFTSEFQIPINSAVLIIKFAENLHHQKPIAQKQISFKRTACL